MAKNLVTRKYEHGYGVFTRNGKMRRWFLERKFAWNYIKFVEEAERLGFKGIVERKDEPIYLDEELEYDLKLLRMMSVAKHLGVK